jgi:nucleoside phosphorylase
MTSKVLTHRDYSVGWVCALKEELAAAMLMLDKEHPDLARSSSDQNTYTLGSIGGHNIAIACLPMGDIGNNPAATVATRMTSSFPSIKFWLMVGIGGGVPPLVRLGDIVVSAPVYDTPGLMQWDLGIAQQDNNFRRIGALNKAPEVLRTAITKLRAQHEIRGHDTRLLSILEDIRSKESTFASQYLQCENLEDILFRADYNHVSQIVQTANNREEEEDNDNDLDDEEGEEDGVSNCRYCDRAKVVKRKPRKLKTKIHYGLIASGNQVIKDAIRRDEINEKLEGNILCFEMEAAGITSSHPCLVIRGICGKSLTRSVVLILIRMSRLFRFAQELQLAEICCCCSCCFC